MGTCYLNFQHPATENISQVNTSNKQRKISQCRLLWLEYIQTRLYHNYFCTLVHKNLRNLNDNMVYQQTQLTRTLWKQSASSFKDSDAGMQSSEKRLSVEHRSIASETYLTLALGRPSYSQTQTLWLCILWFCDVYFVLAYLWLKCTIGGPGTLCGLGAPITRLGTLLPWA